MDRTPAQMIAYQLGWMNLILSWETQEKNGKNVVTPSQDYKWNNLGELYRSFYDQYNEYSLKELICMFTESYNKIIELINTYTDMRIKS